MSKSGLTEYKCRGCGDSMFAFPNEDLRVFDIYRHSCVNPDIEKMPPNPLIVHSTQSYMTDSPYLDSIYTQYELDRILNIEAEEQREMKALNKARLYE